MQTVKGIPGALASLDIGIERLDHVVADTVVLPVVKHVQPSAEADSAQLDRLFPRGSLDDLVNHRLQPNPGDPAILLPGIFRQTLLSVRKSLLRLARQDPANATCYGQLAFLLDSQDELGKLAQMYYQSLMQG